MGQICYLKHLLPSFSIYWASSKAKYYCILEKNKQIFYSIFLVQPGIAPYCHEVWTLLWKTKGARFCYSFTNARISIFIVKELNASNSQFCTTGTVGGKVCTRFQNPRTKKHFHRQTPTFVALHFPFNHERDNSISRAWIALANQLEIHITFHFRGSRTFSLNKIDI